MDNEIKIYIADLAAYNNGILHGIWVDACISLDEIQEQIDSLLKSSPVGNSEEIAIHDYEGFEDLKIGEYEGLQPVHDKALFIQEHGKLGAALLKHHSVDFEEAGKSIKEHYRGEYKSVANYAQELTEQTSEVPKHLVSYIDYEKMARDMELSGDIFKIKLGFEKVHIFWNH